MEAICRAKFDAVMRILHDGGSPGTAFAALLMICASLGIVASLLVEFVSPAAGGSGIPEAKAYLNGARACRFQSSERFL